MSPIVVFLLSVLLVMSMAAQEKPAPPQPLTHEVAAEIAGVYYPDFRETIRFYSKEYGTNLELPEVDGRRNTKYLNPHSTYTHFMRFLNNTMVVRSDGSVVVVEAELPDRVGVLSRYVSKKLGSSLEVHFSLLSMKLLPATDPAFGPVLDVLNRRRFPGSLALRGGGFGTVPSAVKIYGLAPDGSAVGFDASYSLEHKNFPNVFTRVPSRMWRHGENSLLVMGGNGPGYGLKGFPEVSSLPIVMTKMPDQARAKLVPAVSGVSGPDSLVGLLDPYNQHFGAVLLLKRPETLRPDKGDLNFFHWRPRGDAVYKDWHLIPGWHPLDGTVSLPKGILDPGTWPAE